MKRAISLLVFLAAVFSFGVVSANENTTSTVQNKREQWQVKKEQAQAQRVEWQTKKEQLQQDIQKRRELIQQNKNELQQRIAEKQKMREQFKEKFTEERCARVQERVKNKTARFDDNKERHTAVYKNLKNRLTKFVERLDAKGYDTSKLKEDLKILDEKIAQFSKDYAAHIAKLNESKTSTCGHSEGEFRGTLVDARALLKTVHQDAQDIRTYVRTVIHKDLQDIRVQKKNKSESSTSGGGDEVVGEGN